MSKVKLLIFDLDGTLINSAPDIISTVHELQMRRGLPLLPESTITYAIGEGLRALIDKVFGRDQLSSADLRRLEDDFVDIYEKNLMQKTLIYDGVLDFLRANVRDIAIVTNKMIHHTQLTLDRSPLGQFRWTSVLGGDSLVSKKPHPLPLLTTCHRAKVTPENAVMIGDGLPDIISARAAGIRSIACAYGYARESLLLAEGPTVVARKFEDISALIEQLEK